MGEQRNLFLAVAIAIAIFLAWDLLVARNVREDQAARRAEEAASVVETEPDAPASPAPPAQAMTREQALAQGERIPIRSPEIMGSISLTGALIDDVRLSNYTRELDPASGVITLLNPRGSDGEYYAYLGWLGQDMPGANTEWRLVSGDALTDTSAITLEYDSPSGIEFVRRVSVDEHFMFTVVDQVTNTTGAPVDLQPYAAVVRRGVPSDLIAGPVHQGMIGMFDNSWIMKKYKEIQKDREFTRRSEGGWMGITDKFWLAAVIPHPDAFLDGRFEVAQRGGDPVFQASWTRDPVTIDPGAVVEIESYVFAGAKRAELLRDYQARLGIHRFVDAIDWGQLFWFLTKPFFYVLEYFAQLVGNFGVAILMLVVVLKAITFPLANMSFKSMARMKQLQPKITELRERFKADPERMQKEQMALFQREKVNPLAGCLPLLVQIPIFWALYKTLYVTIEMRHAPFFGWIRDLSAPDPTNIWNLFGLLPYDPGAIPLLGWLIGGGGWLALGAWPLLYGLTMAAMQTLNPPPPDPMQQRIFSLMPWIFMFVLAQFAAGLLIYWVWNNILSFIQQYVIMRRQGVETPIGSFVSKRFHDLRARLAPGGGGGTGGGS
jgi:YidC/Oxa1 family membrane protein insertase